jgi:uncharacterized protein (DUF305 family)
MSRGIPVQISSRVIVRALAATALASGLAACGDDGTDGSAGSTPVIAEGVAATSPARSSDTEASGKPEESSGQRPAPERGSVPEGSSPVDAAYVRQMLPHDAIVVVMARQAQTRSKRAEIKDIADSVQESQVVQLRKLRRVVGRRGYDTADAVARQAADAKAMGVRPSALGTPANANLTDRKFDKAFVKLLIAHHEGSIAMSRAERKRGQDDELKGIALDLIKQQKQELALLKVLANS